MHEMKRTATCGQLTAADAGGQVTLNGWVARIRDHGGITFVDLRDRYGVTQVVFDLDAAASDPPAAGALAAAVRDLKLEYCIAVRGSVRRRPPAMVNPRPGHRRDRGHRRPAPGAEHLRHPPLHGQRPARRPQRGARGAAPQAPLPRPALGHHAAQPGAASPCRSSAARGPQRTPVPGDRDSHPDALHPRGGARLRGAVAAQAGQLLRPAAVTADPEAAADAVGVRPLLPVGALLPRRGRPRRPPAGVHPARLRDELRRPGGGAGGAGDGVRGRLPRRDRLRAAAAVHPASPSSRR